MKINTLPPYWEQRKAALGPALWKQLLVKRRYAIVNGRDLSDFPPRVRKDYRLLPSDKRGFGNCACGQRAVARRTGGPACAPCLKREQVRIDPPKRAEKPLINYAHIREVWSAYGRWVDRRGFKHIEYSPYGVFGG